MASSFGGPEVTHHGKQGDDDDLALHWRERRRRPNSGDLVLATRPAAFREA